MKKCLLFALGDYTAGKGLGYRFSQGIIKKGYKIEQHYPSLLRGDNPPWGDIILCNGFRRPMRDACEALKKRADVDTILFDLGYIHRSDTANKNGYYQLGLNRIGWVPDFDCPSDRFDNLQVKLQEVKDNGSNKVLVCAQKFNDAQHEMGPGQVRQYMHSTCKKLVKRGFEVIFRPHPKSKFEIEMKGVTTSRGLLKDDLEACRFMVTHNSTAGVEAVLAGKPVIALDPEAHYQSICSELNDDNTLTLPSMEDQVKYFNRLAYAQWKIEEAMEGYPFDFLLAVIEGKDPFALEVDYTALQPKGGTPNATEHVKQWLCIDNLSWTEARSHVRDVTGLWAATKEHLLDIVNRYNAQA